MTYNVHGKHVEVDLSFDDGCLEDLRIAELLREHHLPAIFYIPSRKRELSDEQVRSLAEDFSIGGHTMNHRILRSIPEPDAETEIVEGKEEMDRLIGAQTWSFCYPRGRFNDTVKWMVRDAGYREARTTKVFATHRSDDPYELDTTIHAYPRTEYAGRHWLGMAIEYFDRTIDPEDEADYFHLWGHGWEIQKLGYWKDLGVLLRYMAEKLHQR